MSDKKKYELEYLIKSAPKILYNRLGTPDGLEQWFADAVKIEDDILTFTWDNNDQQAKIIGKKANDYIRFRWLDEDEDTYFEFKIKIDDITSEVALIITDFADEDEVEEATLLWDSQVNSLMRLLGS